MKSMTWKENELKEYKLRAQQLDSTGKETEQLQRSIHMLKSQYEREKRLVDDKMREVVLLQTSSSQDKQLIRENMEIKQMNVELQRVLREERAINEELKTQMLQQMEGMKQKIINIENGCAKDIVLKLKTVRNEILYKVDKSLTQISDQQINESVDQILGDICLKTNHILKQRESL